MQKSKIKLLIADDSSVFRQILIDFFDESDDIEIIGVAENGADAFKAIQTKLPDVVVLDILMPIHDGLWVLEELQAHGLDKIVKPIVVTAIDSDNIAKIVLDSLNKIAFDDDAQVVELTVVKKWTEEQERIEFELEEVKNEN